MDGLVVAVHDNCIAAVVTLVVMAECAPPAGYLLSANSDRIVSAMNLDNRIMVMMRRNWSVRSED
jgi:hypothetical protein